MATVESYRTTPPKDSNGSPKLNKRGEPVLGELRYRVRYRTPERRQTDKRGFKTKKDADAFAATIEVAKLRNEYVTPTAGRATVADLFELWRPTWVKLKETTKSTRESNWHKHVEPRWGSVRVSDVKTEAVEKWVAELTASTGVATIENALGILRMVMDRAIAAKRVAVNPTAGVELPRRVENRRGYLNHQQVQQLARAVGGEADDSSSSTVIGFLSYTGLRWGEMAALTVSSIDLNTRRIKVSMSVTEVRGKLVYSPPKNWETRSVPFPSFLLAPISKLVEGKGRDALVFTAAGGQVLRVSTFRNRVFAPAVKVCQAADAHFPRVTPHDLRHTAASLAISAGANPKAVQTMLGHKSAAMTLDTYSDLFADDLDAVADHLNHAVTSTVVGNLWAKNSADLLAGSGK